MPKDVAQYVDVKFTYHIPKSGIYQIDLIHPYVSDDSTPSYRMSLLGRKKEGIIGKRINMDVAMKYHKKITTPVTLVYLAEGEHQGTIGGKFVGFSHIAITPLAEDDPRLLKRSHQRQFKICRHRPIHSGVCRFADR